MIPVVYNYVIVQLKKEERNNSFNIPLSIGPSEHFLDDIEDHMLSSF